jgi:hypothetical protein
VAHIYALAASAGLNYGVNYKFDYGIDGQFSLVNIRKDAGTPSGTRRVNTGYPLEFQAKATYDWEIKDGHVMYDLEVKNYNDIVLRSPAETMLILILLCLPKEAKEWHNTDQDETVLRHCCYWHSFSGEPTDNTSKKRIKIPVEQRLTPEVLLDLMHKEKERRNRQAAA